MPGHFSDKLVQLDPAMFSFTATIIYIIKLFAQIYVYIVRVLARALHFNQVKD